MTLSFKQIPSTLRTPFVFAEVDPSNSNTAPIDMKGLIVGQLLATGSRALTVPTSAATASGNTLTFASAAAIANLVPGPFVFAIDRTTLSAIPALTSVLSKSSGTVTLSGTVTGVLNADSIQFIDLTPVWMTSQTNAVQLFGNGSQLARMNAARLQADSFNEYWALPLPDDIESTAATGTITFAGTVSATSVLSLYVAGTPVPVVFTSGMTAAQAATAVAAAINAALDPLLGALPVSAAASSGVVTCTALNTGATGNDIDLRINLYGPANNEFTPPGITVTIAAMAGGATNPFVWMTAGLNTLPPYNWGAVAFPYNDTTSLNDMQTWMGDVAGQWAWSKMKYGCAYTALRTTLGNLQTDGTARNDQHVSVMGVYNSPQPCDIWAAVIAASALSRQIAQPGASFNAMTLPGLVPPAPSDRFHLTDQNTLLWSGISTFTVQGGVVSVQKLITTYQVNTYGDPDDSFFEVETMYRIAYALLYMKGKLETEYAGFLLADDGTRFGPGINVVTPSIAAARLLGLYQDLIDQAICQDLASFKAGLVVQRNTTNRGRLDVLWPGIMVDDLDIIAILAQPVT